MSVPLPLPDKKTTHNDCGLHFLKAKLSYYTFKYDKREGRRQLGVLPPDVAHVIPDAFSTFSLPVVLPDGSRSRVEGVPNVDWTHLFAHTVAVTQVQY